MEEDEIKESKIVRDKKIKEKRNVILKSERIGKRRGIFCW